MNIMKPSQLCLQSLRSAWLLTLCVASSCSLCRGGSLNDSVNDPST